MWQVQPVPIYRKPVYIKLKNAVFHQILQKINLSSFRVHKVSFPQANAI